jgi:2-keto-4-pentenoate hydratase/2-oxohepta-3-ene-1,7-dioic acid hydratase in catechol pathway
MKLVSFQVQTPTGNARRLGAVIQDAMNDKIADLTACFTSYLALRTDEPTPRELANLRVPPDMLGWLAAGNAGRQAADAAVKFALENEGGRGIDGETLVYALADVRLLAPVPRPLAFRDFSIYEEHMTKVEPDPLQKNARLNIQTPTWYTHPPYYKGNCNSIYGPEDPVIWPYYAKRLDLELEVGIVVGRGGRNLSVAQAKDHIAGYTILIDSSARDGFEREPFGPTKRKDFHTAIGPFLVTPDEVGDAENLACRVEVEGEVWYEGSTAAPHSFRFEQLVAYASDNETLYSGELIGTGTIGLSCSMDSHRWIKAGQSITFWIERLGSMTLQIVPGEEVVSHVRGMEGLLKFRPSSH